MTKIICLTFYKKCDKIKYGEEPKILKKLRSLRSPNRSVLSVTSLGGVLCYCPLSILTMTEIYKKSSKIECIFSFFPNR